jgi:hypothetical protein
MGPTKEQEMNALNGESVKKIADAGQQVPETKNETTGKEESKETKQILLTEYQAKLHAE